jgi:5-methylcytosine-specific restriction endonuclease McrA
MATYLFAWNPSQKAPPSFRDEIRTLKRRGSVRMSWRTIRQQMPTGSRAFFIRLGQEPRGIIGAGWTRMEPFDSGVEMQVDALQDTPIIPFSVLQHRPLSRFHWSIQGSGIEVPTRIAAHLEGEWEKHLLAATRQTAATQPTKLYEVGIYTNASSHRLREASRGAEPSRPITENKRWVTGRKLLDKARALGIELPLVFAQYQSLSFWAVVRDIVLHEKTTEYRFANLRRLNGFERNDLVVNEGGKRLPNSFIRPYALIRTPDFLSRRSRVDDGSQPEELIGLEGEERTRMVLHRRREGRLRKKKIDDALQLNGGRLICEVPACGFDFLKTYGALGKGYAQVHHLRPLSDYSGVGKTRLEDLAIVCANCHAMIHRRGKCRKLAGLIIV